MFGIGKYTESDEGKGGRNLVYIRDDEGCMEEVGKVWSEIQP